jgi:hypothetical protein
LSKLILLGVSLAVVWWWYFVGLYIVKTAKQHKKQRSQREDDKRKRMLTMTAIGEHENGLLPHIDPNVIEVCTVPSCNGAGHAFNLYKSMPTPEDAQELGYPPETLSSKLRKLDKQELSPDERDAEERRILATWRHQK